MDLPVVAIWYCPVFLLTATLFTAIPLKLKLDGGVGMYPVSIAILIGVGDGTEKGRYTLADPPYTEKY